ncbi:MAG: hypothetical protein HN703_01540 [Planctomycetaceae bacterium]|nr:hypothetical protein [Planctomycetaceae bacterium]
MNEFLRVNHYLDPLRFQMPAEQEKKSVNKILEKTRGRDLSELLEQIQSLSDKDTPGFVVGDFNVPSHRDCAEKAAWSGRHPIKVCPHLFGTGKERLR